MDWFNIIVGVSSIGSFVVAVVALFKVNDIQNHIVKTDSYKAKVTANKNKLDNQSTMQNAGRDINNKGD